MEIYAQNFPSEPQAMVDSDSESDYASDAESAMVDSDSESDYASDAESGVSGGSFDRFPMFGGGLIRLSETNRVHEIVRGRFLAGLGSLGAHTSVVAIHKNYKSTELGKARALSFHVFSKAVEANRGGNANVKFAWYAAPTKEAIETIVSHGFYNFHNNGLYGSGLYLSPFDSLLDSVKSLKIGEDGLRHLLLCRVILGNTEVVHIGSNQYHPSSNEFDSGVDSVSNPKKYIVWSAHMNSHILPECIISFRAPPSLKGFVRTPEPPRKQRAWIPFSVLVPALSKVLPKQTMDVLAKYVKDHREKKITRNEFKQRLRQIAGDELLIAAIKSFCSKYLVGRNGTS